jgi:hypothetical protein
MSMNWSSAATVSANAAVVDSVVADPAFDHPPFGPVV